MIWSRSPRCRGDDETARRPPAKRKSKPVRRELMAGALRNHKLAFPSDASLSAGSRRAAAGLAAERRFPPSPRGCFSAGARGAPSPAGRWRGWAGGGAAGTGGCWSRGCSRRSGRCSQLQMWFSCGVKLKDPFSSGPVPLQRCLFPNKSERWQRRGFDFVGFIYWFFLPSF